MTGTQQRRARFFISGRVQGVCFRAYTEETARGLGVTGFVCNLPDGRVQVVVEGDQPAIERLADWCRQGPRMANVEAVQVEWLEYQGEFDDFTVRYY